MNILEQIDQGGISCDVSMKVELSLSSPARLKMKKLNESDVMVTRAVIGQ
jgi:hypothetical protein